MNAINFSQWLKSELDLRGWNQSELSRRSGISNPQISRLINMQSTPGDSACRAIAKALKLPAETVFRAAGLLPPTVQHSPIEDQIILLLRELPPEEQDEILELLRFKTQRQTKTSRSNRLETS